MGWLPCRIVGASRVFELLLTRRFVTAAEARDVGLVSPMVEPDALRRSALDVAGQICAHSPYEVRMTKQVMWAQLEIGTLEAGVALVNRT